MNRTHLKYKTFIHKQNIKSKIMLIKWYNIVAKVIMMSLYHFVFSLACLDWFSVILISLISRAIKNIINLSKMS